MSWAFLTRAGTEDSVAHASCPGCGAAIARGVVGAVARRTAAELRPAGPGWATVERHSPHRVQLVPGVLHVIDPCTGQTDAIAYVWLGEMAAIASHKLDDQ